ncbi:serine hydrolase domain-containing protein [Agrococcus sp. Marseille-P2731]|uniref:serine hydrolase domain-containing protein n=1 Tax=Agrococcus sp. Marseille-P2731 TaxID=1841862 RepID=UPI0009F8A768|nr:serine hydrolase domain-containing protein [Agrococcus sp. Marseille-P2731]
MADARCGRASGAAVSASLRERLQRIADVAVERHGVPGVVGALSSRDGASVVVAGARSLGGAPMTPDTVFRIASVTKPLVAAAAMVLVDRGTLRLDDPVERWLPELAAPRVLRDPAGPLDEAQPAHEPIRVGHLLALRGGLGFAGFASTPLTTALAERLHQAAPHPSGWPAPDAWIARAARLPLLHEPGRGWSYNTGLDLAGVLLARAAGSSLGDVLADTLLEPLGMEDTGFRLRDDQVPRTAAAYARQEGELVLRDPAAGAWAGAVPFESGAGGLVSTVEDLLSFGRMLVAGGRAGGRRVLSETAVAQMLAPGEPSSPDHPFLEGQSWSLGGSVDVVERQPWEVLGRYGWIGGTGTALYVYPDAQAVLVWLTQHALGAPDDADRIVPPLLLAAQHARELAR